MCQYNVIPLVTPSVELVGLRVALKWLVYESCGASTRTLMRVNPLDSTSIKQASISWKHSTFSIVLTNAKLTSSTYRLHVSLGPQPTQSEEKMTKVMKLVYSQLVLCF